MRRIDTASNVAAVQNLQFLRYPSIEEGPTCAMRAEYFSVSAACANESVSLVAYAAHPNPATGFGYPFYTGQKSLLKRHVLSPMNLYFTLKE